MAISSQNRKAGPYSGNASTTRFPFVFKVFSANEVRVVHTNPHGDESDLVLGTDYRVELNANQEANPGGAIVVATAPGNGFLITATSQVQKVQPVALTNQGGFYPRVINDALDRLTILVQQVDEQVARAVKVDISSNIAPSQLIRTLSAESAAAVSAAASAQSSRAASAASAATAATAASTATTQAANALVSANSASNSATSTATAAATAATQAANALASAHSASNSATSTANAAATAATQAATAVESANSARTSATSASTSANTATTQATNALASANRASNSAERSHGSAIDAAGASTTAVGAAASAVNAAASVTAPVARTVASYLDSFIPTGALVGFATMYVVGGWDLGGLSVGTPFINEAVADRRASLSAGSGTFDFGTVVA